MKGGKRPGAGRKPGKKTAKTLERDAVLRAYNERVMRSADILLNAQMTLARGVTYLFKIEKEWVSTGTTKAGKSKGFYRKLKPKIVENLAEIQDYLEGLVEEGDGDNDQDAGATYYFLTTKSPDSRAISDMLNRPFGTPVQSTKIVDETGKSLPIATINVMPLEHEKVSISRQTTKK